MESGHFKRDRRIATASILLACGLLVAANLLDLVDVEYFPIRFGMVVAAAILMFSTLMLAVLRYRWSDRMARNLLLTAMVLFAISLSLQLPDVNQLMQALTGLSESDIQFSIEHSFSELGLGLFVLVCVSLFITASMKKVEADENVKLLRKSETNLRAARDHAEQAEEKMLSLNRSLEHASRLSVMGEMVAGIAHEINQPLGAIANYANGGIRKLDSGNVVSEELEQTLRRISSESMRAGKIIKRIRSFVQERSRANVDVDINSIVRDALQLAKSNIHEQEIETRLLLAEEVQPIFADPIQITQVVLNLIINAVEAMQGVETGRRHLTVETRQSAENELVEVVVKDTGTGIPREIGEKIFEQFTTTKPNGLGIGLAISSSIAEAHGGRLSFTSRPGEETEFRMTLSKKGGLEMDVNRPAFSRFMQSQSGELSES